MNGISTLVRFMIRTLVELTGAKRQGDRVYHPSGIAPAVQASFGMGGNQVTLILVTEDIKLTVETSQPSLLQISPPTTSSAADSLAKLSVLLGSEGASMKPEALYSLKSLESHGITEPRIYSLRTSKDSSTTIAGARSRLSFERWTNLGMTANGRCLTARISVSPKTGRGSSLSDILEDSPDPKYFLSDKMTAFLMNDRGKFPPQLLHDTTSKGKATHTLLQERLKKSNSSTSLNTPTIESTARGGVAPTLNTMQGGNRQPFVFAERGRYKEDGKMEQRAEPRFDGVSNTLTAVEKDNRVFDGRIRRLTPMECERLQGFPDNWTAEGVNGVMSDTQRYKQMGNAVTVNVIQAIASKL